jgi:hypothetical protein
LGFCSHTLEFLWQRVRKKPFVTELSHKPPRYVISLLFFAATREEILFRPLTHSRAELQVFLIEEGQHPVSS